ncbi:MAG TPA: ABC transporter permease [Gemmatimonadaceae bacterium]|jgi:putative ABC transport system permease protein|nr:ABC transporter permease [Gemmatimonadaceae bacterium]
MRRYPLRTFLMMLGSIVGVAALTFVLSVGRGAQEVMLRTVRQILGDQAILIQAGGGTMMGGPRGGSARLTLDDMDAVAREVPEIDAWDPQVQKFNAAVKRGGASATARVLGESERWSPVWQRGVSRGQDFDAAAVTGMGRVALIGETVVHSLFAGEDPIGGEVEIGNVPFRVIGVLDRFGVDLHGMDRDNEIVVPVTTMMRRVKNVDDISGAKLIVKNAGREEEAAEQVRRVLRARHGLAGDQADDFHMMTSTEIHRMESKIERVLLLYVPLVGAVALVVGGIVAAVIMLASVSERVAEIGLRTAVGAGPDDIRRQFMLETATTIVLGGAAGIVLGILAVKLATRRMPISAPFSWSAVLVGLAAAAITGLMAGVAPARRAAHLNPVDALR